MSLHLRQKSGSSCWRSRFASFWLAKVGNRVGNRLLTSTIACTIKSQLLKSLQRWMLNTLLSTYWVQTQQGKNQQFSQHFDMFTALITQSNCWQREMKAQSTGSARRSSEQLGFLFYFNGGLESSTALGHHHSTTAEFVCYIIYHFSWSILFIEDLLKYLLYQAKNMSLKISDEEFIH